MPFRLIALDLDGTTLDASGKVRPRVAEAIGRARERGVAVALATGRRLETTATVGRELGVDYLILTDGTVVYDLQRDLILSEQSFSPALQRRAIDLVREAGLPPILFESPAAAGRVLIGPPELDNPELLGFVGTRPSVTRLPIDDLAGVPRIVTILGMGAETLVERLAERCDGSAGCVVTFWRPTRKGYTRPTLTFAPPETSKGHALVWLADYLGLPRSETLAVGDHLNDIPLIRRAGLGVAMGNALPEVKSEAGAVVADHENDGVAEAIERWVLS